MTNSVLDIVPPKYKNRSKEYRTSDHIVYSCQYHVIFCPKYRRHVLVPPYDARLKEIFTQVAEENSFLITDLEIMPDHVHMIIDCNPKFGVCKCVKLLKGVSSRIMRDEFPELKKKLPSLWTHSYFVSTVGSVTLEVVKQYIENQKNK